MKKIFVAVVLALPIVACLLLLLGRTDPTVYAPDKIVVRAEGLHEDGLTLHFRPPSEVGYCCPGVRFRHEGSAIHYEYVRSRVGENVPVDIAVKNEQNGDLSVTFPFLGGKWEKGDRIELIDSRGKSHGEWRCLGVL
jgi:hypothetical protein